MSNWDTHISCDYALTMMQRASSAVDEGAPDWEDQPSCFKTYRQVERLALPTGLLTPPTTMADLLARMRAPQHCRERLSFEAVATTLLLAQGVLSRRLGVGWSRDRDGRTIYHQAATAHGRGTTTSAGTHPTEIYWACGPSGPLLSGLYHYDPAHHALERLFTGDVTGRIQAAVADHPEALATDQFLLVTANAWKSGFVHRTRTYHAVTQDVGALFCSLRLVALSFGCDPALLLWYQDEALNRLLGLDRVTESVFAVVPVPTTVRVPAPPERDDPAAYVVKGHAHPKPSQHVALVSAASFQRSQVVSRFPESERVHLASLIEKEPRPDGRAARASGLYERETSGERVDLPPVTGEYLHSDVVQVFQQRTSSASRFTSRIPLSRAELATVLSFGASARGYLADLKESDGTPSFTGLLAVVNAVEGVACGAYAYESERHCLWSIRQGEVTWVLPHDYFLPKYNLAETGVVLAITGRLDPLLDIYGNRGYRLLQAEVGIVLQSIYLGATALGLGCGWKRGLDERVLNEALGLEDSGQQPLLFVILGHVREGKAGFDGRLL